MLRLHAAVPAEADWEIQLFSVTGTTLGKPVNPVPRSAATVRVSNERSGSAIRDGPTTGDLSIDSVHPVYSSLSTRMVKALERVFLAFDRNGDHAWDMQEFNAFQIACGDADEMLPSAEALIAVCESAGLGECCIRLVALPLFHLCVLRVAQY